EIVAQLKKHNDAAIDWNELEAALKAKYPTFADGLVAKAEERFRGRVANEIDKDLRAGGTPNWERIEAGLKQRYPGYDYEGPYLYTKTKYFYGKKLWPQSCEALYSLMQRHGEQYLAPLNDMVWSVVFLNCNDESVLRESAKWMKRAIEWNPKDERQM